MYNRPIQGGHMKRTWRERMMNRFGLGMSRPLQQSDLIVPHWFTGKALVFFFVAMFACWGAFGHIPDFDLIIAACLLTVLFFYGSSSMSKSWCRLKGKAFVKNVFVAGLSVRLLWILYMYFVFNPARFGTTYGPSADIEWYMDFGEAIAQWVRNGFNGSFHGLRLFWKSAIDDVGYPLWLSIISLVTNGGSDVFVPFCVKSLVSAYCAVCIYHIANRHFGEGVARISAIFVALNPNMIYWSGSMMKETEMVFVACLALDELDKALSSGNKLTLKSLWPGMLAGIYLFFFRSALGLALFLAVLAHVVMASHRVMDTGKKIIVGILVLAITVFSLGDRLLEQSRSMYEDVQSGGQQKNMEWRSNRAGGNAFARYAGAAVFAPLIFTIPFPTFNVANESQLIQMQLSGGSYIKNILSFFVLIVMFLMLISGEWRRHVFILAYTLGYLAMLVFSSYAQSGRFHMPIMPMLLLFAAYGIQIAKVNGRIRKWFPIVLVIEVVACLAWGWFKLKGRGMI